MNVVKHQNSKAWYFRFSLNGKVHFGSTKTTNKALALKIAREKYNETLAQQELGDKPTITVQQALTKYLEKQENNGEYRNIKTYVSKLLGTKKSKQTGTPLDIYGLDGTMPLNELQDSHLQNLVFERRGEGNADATILQELILLNKCIRLMGKLGYSTPNIDMKDLKKDNRLQPSRKKLRYLTIEEEQRLLDELDPSKVSNKEIRDERTELYDLTILGLDTGARYSELAHLTWASVDMETKSIHVFREKVSNQSVLYMTERMVQVFERRYKNKRADQVYVFENTDKTGPRNYVVKGFNGAVERSNLEDVTFHTLRKTHASRLVQAGVPILNVSQLLGHSTTAITESTYAFLAPNQSSRAAVEVLNRLSSTSDVKVE